LALMTASQIEAGLVALERLRGELDDAVLDVALAALRERLWALQIDDTRDPHEQRLRQVTVLFVDVVDSTALGGQLQPEDVHLVMDGALERFTALVTRHNGRVLQYAGDSLLAAFGTTEVREDDAQNAVLAGLDIVAEARLQAVRVQQDHGHPGFNVRVGLHTGPVLLGAGVDAAHSIRGATVNLAARMEQSAPPGRVRISADTQRLVAGQFEVHEQPPLHVKGHAQALHTYLVERRVHGMSSARRGVAGLHTPLIGRDAALLALQQAWGRLHAQPAPLCNTVLLLGEAGMGKSRVLREWQAWGRAQPAPVLWLQAQARPQQARVPYALLRDLLAQALALPDSDTPAQARERFSAAVAPWLQQAVPLHADDDVDYDADADADELPAVAALAETHVLGHLLGLNFSDSPHVRGIVQQGGQIRQRGLHAAAQLLAQWSTSRQLPLLLCLDDVHWADDATLDFVRSLPSRTWALPVLVLLAARPTLDERRPDWAARAAQRVTLLPLRAADSAVLAQALLAPLQPASPTLQDLLVQRAGGNPFFMEELLKMLLDQGVIQRDGAAAGQWTLQAAGYDLGQVPASLNGVLQARLGTLPGAERRALQQASVLGALFWQATLAALDAAAPAQLPALCQRSLLHMRSPGAADRLVATSGLSLATPSVTPAAEFAFAHVILQQVSYQRLLRAERQALHAAAGQWYASLETARAVDFFALAAEHFEQAGRLPQALHYRVLACENLAQRFAHDAVIEQASKGLAVAAAHDDGACWKLLLLRQRARRLSGQRQAQAQDLDALQALAERSGDALQRATVAFRRVVAADETGHPQLAAELAPAALTLAQQAQDGALEVAVHGAWAGALQGAGRYAQAQTVAEDGLRRARTLADLPAQAELLVALAAVATEQGDVARSPGLLRQALAIQQRCGDRAGECTSRINLAVAAMQWADFAAAAADLDAAVALVRVTGNRTHELSAILNRASTRLALGDLPGARLDAERVLRLAQDIENPEHEAFAHMTLGAVLLQQAQWLAACQSFEQSHRLLMALALPHLAIEAVAWLARAALLQGDWAAALPGVEEVLAHRQQHGHFKGTEKPLLLRLTCCQVLLAAGDARAPAEIADSWAELQTQSARLADAPSRERFISGHAHHAALRELALSAAAGAPDATVPPTPPPMSTPMH
jgi:predicted ATPase/class 3 adenylate cyclase